MNAHYLIKCGTSRIGSIFVKRMFNVYPYIKLVILDISYMRSLEMLREELKNKGYIICDKEALNSQNTVKIGGDLIVREYAITCKIPVNIICCLNDYRTYYLFKKLITLTKDRQRCDFHYVIDSMEISEELEWLQKNLFCGEIMKANKNLNNQGWVKEFTFSNYMNYYKQMYNN